MRYLAKATPDATKTTRLREFVLGGATRGILSTMTVPVFMSH